MLSYFIYYEPFRYYSSKYDEKIMKNSKKEDHFRFIHNVYRCFTAHSFFFKKVCEIVLIVCKFLICEHILPKKYNDWKFRKEIYDERKTTKSKGLCKWELLEQMRTF